METNSFTQKENCPVCNKKLFIGYASWHFICKNCKYEKSNLEPNINSNFTHKLLNENSREIGLKSLRINNFNKLIKKIRLLKPNGGDLLDIGCGHGWFLEISKNYFNVFGLEPDKNIFNTASELDLPIRLGYFPDALNKSEKFDIIIFNDVIEHIHDTKYIIQSSYQHLNKNGLLILNLPNSNGIFYKMSKILYGLGFSSFFERLWQKDLPSPHVHYFNKKNLNNLLSINKFNLRKSGFLSTLHFKALYKRISYTKNFNTITKICVYLCICFLFPVFKILPKDIMYLIYTKE